MKNIKSKLISLLLSISVLPAVFPLKNAEAASKTLFIEDFESYATGRLKVEEGNVYDSAGKLIPGMYATIIGDDFLEIVEENGNKYLVIETWRNANELPRTYFGFNFGEGYKEGVKEISYKYKTIMHRACFRRFGCIFYDETNPTEKTMQHIWSQGATVITKINEPLFGWNDELYGWQFNGKFGYVKQTLDYNKDENNYELVMNYGSKTTSRTLTVKNLKDKPTKGINWGFSSYMSYGENGKESPYTENYGRYAFDDVAVKSMGFYVAEATVQEEESISADSNVVITFEEAPIEEAIDYVELYKNGELVEKDEYNISLAGNSLTIDGFDYNSQYSISIKNTLKSMSGKYMTDDYLLNFKTDSIIKHSIAEGKRYTNGYAPTITPVDGIVYEYYMSKDGGEFAEYDLSALSETGKYSLKIVATGVNGKTQTEIVNFDIVDAIAPEVLAVEVVAEGTPGIDTVLNGRYTYFDVNDDKDESSMDYCKYQWYRADSEDGEFLPMDGANEITYTLTEADEDKYIKFSVKPFSKEDPKEGKETFSDAFLSFMNPKVQNIIISGKMATDEKLTVDYEYSDLNGDEEITEGENATVIIWKTADAANGDFAEVGRGKNYKIKDADSNKWIKVEVMPKNNGAGRKDAIFESEAIMGAFAPVVQDVKLTGNVNVGSTISVDYKYYDENHDPEGTCTFEWYVGEKLVSNDINYKITSADAGKAIYAVVTPTTAIKPTTGVPVKSDVKTVSKKANTVKPSGGGGGGNISVPPTNIEQKPTESEKSEESDKKTFDDVSGHWAEEAIYKMVEEGIIYGKSEKQFAPDDNITRAEFAALICRMFKLSGGENTFSDISEDDWYCENIAAVASAGYMKGADGNFRPNDNIKREEIAVVISEIISGKGLIGSGEITPFTDYEEISDWAKNAVNNVAESGIIKGMKDGSFMPKGNATRAQTVTMLLRLQEAL